MSEVQSLARGLKILDLLAQAEDGLGISQIAEHLGVDKSSAWRLMQTLAGYGYARQEPATRRYHLGAHVVGLSYNLLSHIPLRDQAREFLYQLVSRTGECAHLAIYDQGQALVIDDVETNATLRVITGVGRLAPLNCTAIGKCLLAFCNVPLPSQLEAYTAHSISDMETLRIHLQQVRSQGFALDSEELTPGVRCLAVPIFDYTGAAVGTIGISGPTLRVTPERVPDLAAILMATGHAFSNRLGSKIRPGAIINSPG